ncbi:Glu-tRNA(Gln) amidotransferase GatDE subunit E [Candidatus Bathyarchaeota archaeon B24-2]|nr:MAG: Glu-tRNA(Gln) amidotransferase GatDE subunit E [Candidatus Bathyarchaeota archaeon B24-2]
MKFDYKKLGLKVGLEVHQQLDTRHKLFCACKPELFRGEPEIRFVRRLRPTQSELGQVDEAALFEFRKGLTILYEADRDTSCLVEMDEEPPHELNREAVETSLTVALMLDAKPVDEIHVMRKIVIDGSNTTGFQRTCVVALGGELEVEGKKIPIQHIGLEEDAARKTGQRANQVTYRLDRLGIPLIEVTTGPVISSPEEARKVALAIGRILRATGKVKRGIGTVRQDLNISLARGALIEIKGVQELETVEKAVEYEVQRQVNLLKIREELERRGVREEDLAIEPVDVTEVFENTKCKVISKALSRGGKVLALKLKGFNGLLGRELAPNLRFGTELADIARFWGGVGGIFHTDEMPGYGVTEAEIDGLRSKLDCTPEDAVVFVADSREKAEEALKAVAARAREALKGVPEETRVATPEGTSRYMRPRPGAARMYPETDVPPIRVTEDLIERLRKALPEKPEALLQRLMAEYGLNQKLSRQLMDSEYLDLFERIVKEVKVSPTLVAVTLTETLRSLKRDGLDVASIRDDKLTEVFKLVGSGVTAKESIPEILAWLSKNPDKSALDAVKALNLERLPEEELRRIVDEAIEDSLQLIKERGLGAFGPLMGRVMSKVRGRADAKTVSAMIKERIHEIQSKPDPR